MENEKHNLTKEGGPPNKRAKVTADAATREPVKFPGKLTFCLILIVEPDEDCQTFLKECQQACSGEDGSFSRLHENCFQRDGTLHFTLFIKALTYEQAMAYQVDGDTAGTLLSLPVMKLTGFFPWPSCVAVKSSTSITPLLQAISPTVTPPKNMHMSLYRGRGADKAAIKQRFALVRNQTKTMPMGSARGVRVVLKEMGKEYDGTDGGFFRVLAEAPATVEE